MKPHTLMRWLLVPPAALAGWWLALALGLVLLRIGNALCPPELMVSGACIADWSPAYERSVFVACTAIAAMLVTLLPVLVAPARRRNIAWLAFGCGSAAALWLGILTSAWPEFAGALLAGTLTLALLLRRLPPKPAIA